MTTEQINEIYSTLNAMEDGTVSPTQQEQEENQDKVVGDGIVLGQSISCWDSDTSSMLRTGEALLNPWVYIDRHTYQGPITPHMKLWDMKQHNVLMSMPVQEVENQLIYSFQDVAEFHAKQGASIEVITDQLLKCHIPFIRKHYNITDNELVKIAASTYKELHYRYSSIEPTKQEQVILGAFTDSNSEEGFNELEVWMNTRTEQFSFDIPHMDEGCGGGIMRGEVLSIIGNPGSMKTSLLLRGIMHWLAQNENTKVVMFSLDMDKSAIYERLFMRQVGCDSNAIRWHYMNKTKEYQTARKQLWNMTKNRLDVVQNTGKNRWNVKAVCDYIAVNTPDLVCIDYLTLLKSGKQSDYEVANEASIALKEIAQKYNCCVVILSQMSMESRRIQANGGQGGSAKGGGIINELATMELELFRDVSTQEDDYAPRIIATITKTRRGIAGASYMLDYKGPSMTFTGQAKRVKRCNQRKPVFES